MTIRQMIANWAIGWTVSNVWIAALLRVPWQVVLIAMLAFGMAVAYWLRAWSLA